MSKVPLVSFLTPVYRPHINNLRAAVQSVLDQDDNDWELILVDDASNDPQISALLAEYAKDPRIVVQVRAENGGIVAASNDALTLARGQLVASLDHDDVVSTNAVSCVKKYLAQTPAAEVLYSDRRHIDEQNKKTFRPFKKPTWSPERLRCNMYIAHLTVLGREAALAVGGFRPEYEGAQDHDLVLRITERGNPVIGMPELLYSWRATPQSTAGSADAKPYARNAGLRAVTDHCVRMGIRARPEHSKNPGFYAVNRIPKPGSKVSIIIPTRGTNAEVFGEQRCLVVEVIRSITDHEYSVDYEFVVVHDVGGDDHYLEAVAAAAKGRLRLVPYREPFNFARKVNVGALHATGDILLLLNDDMEVISPNWLDHLAGMVQQPDVGVVGAKLMFENGLIQSAGLGVMMPGLAFDADRGKTDFGGHFGATNIDHEIMGVTGACMAVRASVYFELGGFCEDYPSAFNDVDFSFKCLLAGYRNVAANSVVLYHFESMSRDPEVSHAESARLLGRWKFMLLHDPYLRGTGHPAIPEASGSAAAVATPGTSGAVALPGH